MRLWQCLACRVTKTRVRAAIAARLDQIGLAHRTDRLGNLIATVEGDGPSVMLFTHMDQLGFVVRKVEDDGFIRVERLGGVPERALASQEVMFCINDGSDIYGIIANKSHHATTPDEKYQVVRYADLYVDAGFSSKAEAEATGIRIGTPVVYAPGSFELGPHRIVGPAVDDRAGCAVQLAVAEALAKTKRRSDSASGLVGTGRIQPARRAGRRPGADPRTWRSRST